MTSMSPQLEVLRVKPVELRAPNFRLSEGLIDLRQGSNRCVHDRRNTFRERGHAFPNQADTSADDCISAGGWTRTLHPLVI
jgi:hypothetical protein